MTSYNVDEPIYAPATAYAPSALAVIRLSGKNTIEMLSQAFSSPSRLNKAAGKTLVHGYILDEVNVRIDEVVLAVYREGSGYTGEEAVEISCHGSLVVLRRLFTRLEQLGFKRAEKGEFTFRAFMHGRMDLTQAEAVEEIIHSKSEISQEKALDRLSGKLRDSLAAVKTRLVDILASLEVQLDYAEDEIIDEWVFPEAEVSSIISSLKALSSTYGASRIYREGAKVVLAGAANAGTIRVLRAMLKGVRNTILLDKQGRPHRPLLHVEEGGEKNLRARPRLAAGLGALPRRANRIAGTGAGRVGGKTAGVRLPLPLHRKPLRAGALRPGAFHHGQDSPRRRGQNAALRPPSPVAAPRPGRPEPLERHQQTDPDRKAAPLLRRLPRRP